MDHKKVDCLIHQPRLAAFSQTTHYILTHTHIRMQNKHTTRVQRDTSKVRKGDRQTEGENLGSCAVCLHKQLQNLLLDPCPH